MPRSIKPLAGKGALELRGATRPRGVLRKSLLGLLGISQVQRDRLGAARQVGVRQAAVPTPLEPPRGTQIPALVQGAACSGKPSQDFPGLRDPFWELRPLLMEEGRLRASQEGPEILGTQEIKLNHCTPAEGSVLVYPPLLLWVLGQPHPFSARWGAAFLTPLLPAPSALLPGQLDWF